MSSLPHLPHGSQGSGSPTEFVQTATATAALCLKRSGSCFQPRSKGKNADAKIALGACQTALAGPQICSKHFSALFPAHLRSPKLHAYQRLPPHEIFAMREAWLACDRAVSRSNLLASAAICKCCCCRQVAVLSTICANCQQASRLLSFSAAIYLRRAVLLRVPCR